MTNQHQTQQATQNTTSSDVSAATGSDNDTKRTIYVFVRTDIPVEQQMVQAAHAAAEASRVHYRPEHGIASLVVLAVRSQAALYAASARMDALGIAHEMFFEPDWEMGHSALATRPVRNDERPLFRAWQLWKSRPAQQTPQPAVSQPLGRSKHVQPQPVAMQQGVTA